MTDATRQALKQVQLILLEAGWDQPAAPDELSITPAELDRIRHAYATYLRHDYFAIMTDTLENRLTVEKAGEKLGLNEEESRQLFREALRRLTDFVEVYGRNGAASGKVASGASQTS